MPRHLVGHMRGRLLLPAEGFGIGPGNAGLVDEKVGLGSLAAMACLISSNVDAADVERASPNAAKQRRRLRAEIPGLFDLN
jgi:hypothetical protein